jgi:hypothetical protein
MVGKRAKGGYECELDVVAFHPEKKHIVQIEPSMDAGSWAKREIRYKKKFDAGKKYIPKLFKGFDLPNEIEQIALFVVGDKVAHQTIGGGNIAVIKELLDEIYLELSHKSILKSAVPEQFPLLRSFQFACEYFNHK